MDDGAPYRIVRYRPDAPAVPAHDTDHLLVLPLDAEIAVRDRDETETRVPPGTAAVLPPAPDRAGTAWNDPGRLRAGGTGVERVTEAGPTEVERAEAVQAEPGRLSAGPAVLAWGAEAGPTEVERAEAVQDDAGRRGAHVLAMTIPARELAPAPAEPLLVDVSAGLGRVVADLVRAVGEEADALDPSEFEAACDRIAELLRMVVAGRATARPSAPGQLAEVEAVVRRYVRAHATDPALTGTVLAQRLGWSLRQIQLALQRAGTTPRALIREERLRLVRNRLRDPADQAVSITDLAHAAGFSSAGALSTAFRRRFGVSPRELRRAARRGQAGTGTG